MKLEEYKKLQNKSGGKKEKEITAEIRQYLQVKKIFHWKVWQGLGSVAGVPDIIGVLEGGKALFIEVKTEKGKVSDKQASFLENVQRLGAIAFVARNLNDVSSRL